MSVESPYAWHRRLFEGRAAVFAITATLVAAIGGIAEIAPMYSATLGPEPMEGITPYTPLELAGRDIYVREGCYNCHSQWVRPFRDEVKRYGEWSRAGEYAYDRPFQLGSRRIGPDLMRTGVRLPSVAWHYEHLMDPRKVVPQSIMPRYPWLAEDRVDPEDVRASVAAMKKLGVPYSDEDVAKVPEQIAEQGGRIASSLKESGIEVAPDSEMVAIIAYLTRLGVEGHQALAAREGEK